MSNSIALSLYLATKARADRAAARGSSHAPDTRVAERSGHPSDPRPAGPLIWFHTGADRHGLSVRELALRLLAEREDLVFLTTTSSDRPRKPSQGHITSQLAPDDTLPIVRRFLDHWQPDVAIWTEPDLRPALITQTANREIPLFLIDAHTAAPDPQAWRWRFGMAGALMDRFEHVMTGDKASAIAFQKLGTNPDRLEIAGFLEEGTPALPYNVADRDALATRFDGRPVWLAAHVTPSEISASVHAHGQALRRSHRLLLILVPDDTTDCDGLCASLIQDGHSVAQRTRGEEPNADTQIYVADTEGEMGLWYRLAPICYLGRSLLDDGGTNPYEAAALGSAIIHGPFTRNFRRAYAKLSAARATRMVRTDDALGDTVEALLSPDVAARLAQSAWNISTMGAEVTDRVKDLILTALEDRGLY